MANILEIKILHQNISEQLRAAYTAQEAQSLAWWLIQHFWKVGRHEAILGKPITIKPTDFQELTTVIDRLLQHEPIQYITGYAEFMDKKIKVNKHTLIPRPETEEIVSYIIGNNIVESQNAIIFDVCTGSGCIAVTLADAFPKAKVSGIDVSPEALAVARENSNAYQLNINWLEGDILQEVVWKNIFPEGQIDLLVSNPPYVTQAEKKLMQANVLDYEPALALFVPDQEPLLFYEELAKIAAYGLKSNGYICLEINEQFGKQTAKCLAKQSFVNIRIVADMQGKDRMVLAQKI